VSQGLLVVVVVECDFVGLRLEGIVFRVALVDLIHAVKQFDREDLLIIGFLYSDISSIPLSLLLAPVDFQLIAYLSQKLEVLLSRLQNSNQISANSIICCQRVD
jgi:hypothetical protein